MTPAEPVPDIPEEDARWRTAGERIENLLQALGTGGSVAQDRAERLVREVTDLYGAGLARMLQIAASADPTVAEAVAADDLVASLLLVHGLHPHPVERRISDALDGVRPYLGSHGGDVHLLEVAPPVVRLRFAGSCKSCPSSAVTLELAIEDAIMAAAPEISSIDVVTEDPAAQVIPAESLLARLHGDGHRHASWQPVPALAELAPGEVGGFSVAGAAVLACRIGDEFFAYQDHCPNCGGRFAGAALSGSELRCPRCGTGFDVVHAGTAVHDATGLHLEPIPVLLRDEVLSMALATEIAS